MNLLIHDNILSNPDDYVKAIHEGYFADIKDGGGTFKGIQVAEYNDEIETLVKKLFESYEIVTNIIRKSPLGQIEPNYIHSDEGMGDITILIYLNKKHPVEAGTIFYDALDREAAKVSMEYNRMVVFDASVNHSRALFDNFGEGEDGRLVQVIFLKFKVRT